MDFLQAKDNLYLHKGVSILFAVVFGFGAAAELIWPGTVPITMDEKPVGPQDGLAYYGTLWAGALIGLAALALFWWLHRRVRRVTANESGLHILGEPVRVVTWSEVHSVRKTMANFLSGFYLITLADGTELYAPIEREAPGFSTLSQWVSDAPAPLEQLGKKHGIWAD